MTLIWSWSAVSISESRTDGLDQSSAATRMASDFSRAKSFRACDGKVTKS